MSHRYIKSRNILQQNLKSYLFVVQCKTKYIFKIIIHYKIMIKMKKSSNESVTFRISTSVLEKLYAQAELQQTSLNTLVNQILTNYADWDMTAIDAGWIVIPKDEMGEILNNLDENAIILAAKKSVERTRDIRLLMTNSNNLDAFLFVLYHRSRKSGFHYKEYRTETSIKIVIQHEMGEKWSIFTKTLYEGILDDLEHPARLEHSGNTLILNIDLNK
jgi:hypothetical protein